MFKSMKSPILSVRSTIRSELIDCLLVKNSFSQRRKGEMETLHDVVEPVFALRIEVREREGDQITIVRRHGVLSLLDGL